MRKMIFEYNGNDIYEEFVFNLDMDIVSATVENLADDKGCRPSEINMRIVFDD